MQIVERNSLLWNYVSEDIKSLLTVGELLISKDEFIPLNLSDYSYVVFPFAKAYEGFLKQLFRDLNLIRDDEFYGDDIRIGRILNPGFVHEHENVFNKLVMKKGTGRELASKLWDVWQKGRNQVFHYFPHNFRKLSYNDAMMIINEIVVAMCEAVKLAYLKED